MVKRKLSESELRELEEKKRLLLITFDELAKCPMEQLRMMVNLFVQASEALSNLGKLADKTGKAVRINFDLFDPGPPSGGVEYKMKS